MRSIWYLCMLGLCGPVLAGGVLDPLAFLVGHCWEGEIHAGTDKHCYRWLYNEQFIIDEHVVYGDEPDYHGTTVYYYDNEDERIEFFYINSRGGVSTGYADVREEGIVFPEKVVSGDDVRIVETVLQPDGADAYRNIAREQSVGGWKTWWETTFQRLEESR